MGQKGGVFPYQLEASSADRFVNTKSAKTGMKFVSIKRRTGEKAKYKDFTWTFYAWLHHHVEVKRKRRGADWVSYLLMSPV